MSEQNTFPSGATFGTPVTQDTPAESLQTHASSVSASTASTALPQGVTFGSPVVKDTPADQANQGADVAARSEAFKNKAWSDIAGNVKQGNLHGAASSFLSLFHNPDEDNPADLLIGMGKGAGQTANTVSSGLSKIVPSVVRPQDVTALSTIEKPTNQAQKVGVGIEGIGEFFLGDEALKGLSLAERAGMLSKVAKLADSHPVLANIIDHGLNAVRGGAVTTGQQLAHGATPTEALETGATAAGLGTGVGAAAEGLGKGLSTAHDLLSTKSIQPAVKKGITEAMKTVTETEGVNAPTTNSVAKVVEETADQVYAKSKSLYGELDAATGGRVQRFTDRLENIRRKLNELTGTEEDAAKEAALLKAQKETEDAMHEAFNDAEAKGVPRDKVDEAKNAFKKSQALYDLDSNIKKATSGMSPDIDAASKNPELVDPEKLFSRVNNLHRSGRLQEALGDGADDLLKHANESVIDHRAILRNQNIAKFAGKVAGYGGLATAGGEVVKHLAAE